MTGITADDLKSTDITNKEFSKLEVDSSLRDMGTNSVDALNTADIYGKSRPNSNNKISIGAMEYSGGGLVIIC